MSDAAQTLQTFLHIGPNAGLGADEHQWILYRAGQPVSYVRSTKAVLVRCIREKGIELSAEGKAALDALADDFNAWKADPTRRGTPVAAETCGPAKIIDADASGGVGGAPVAPRAEMPLEPAEIGPTSHAEVGGSITLIEQLGPSCATGAGWAAVDRAQSERTHEPPPSVGWLGRYRLCSLRQAGADRLYRGQGPEALSRWPCRPQAAGR